MSSYYRVPLTDYKQFEPPVGLKLLFNNYRDELEAIRKIVKNHLFYAPYREEIRLTQGKYLTKVPLLLFNLFKKVLGQDEIEYPSQTENSSVKVFREGATTTYIQTRRERDPDARKAAIEKYGTSCMACGFNFDKFYGAEISLGYAEVHHTKPLADSDIERETSIEELVVLCSNCHRVIHRRKGDMLDWHYIRKIVRGRKKRENKEEKYYGSIQRPPARRDAGDDPDPVGGTLRLGRDGEGC